MMDYYSALRREEISFATMWMDLEDITLSDINLSRKDTACTVPPTRGI